MFGVRTTHLLPAHSFMKGHTRKMQFTGYQRFSHRQRTRLRWPVQKKPRQSTTARCEGSFGLPVNATTLTPPPKSRKLLIPSSRIAEKQMKLDERRLINFIRRLATKPHPE